MVNKKEKMKKIISVLLIIGSFLAVLDLTSAEAITEELIFIFITFHWFWIQKEEMKLPRFIIFSYLFLASTSMHGFFHAYLIDLELYIRIISITLFSLSLFFFIKQGNWKKNE